MAHNIMIDDEEFLQRVKDRFDVSDLIELLDAVGAYNQELFFDALEETILLNKRNLMEMME